ncbi:MAG: FAD binding domain-containing protein [Bacteroidota bacterium]
MISFLLNRKKIVTQEMPGMTLLDFIRYNQHLMGTKIGCREGDCGACTVLIGKFHGDDVKYISMTSCLTPLINVQGCHVVTVEGINGDTLTPVQESVLEEGGTQCGFCTVGFVMSMTGVCMTDDIPSTEKIIASIDGNICRCTGYKSLERAAHRISQLLQTSEEEPRINWLIREGFLPGYFSSVAEQLRELTLTVDDNTQGILTGGGTDLYVQKQESMMHAAIRPVLNNSSLKSIEEKENEIIIGSAVTVEELKNSALLNALFPDLQQHLKLVSSTPIRNMATIAGNFVNASPIGDMTIFFLALNASLTLNHNGNRRNLLLKDFYKGYKTFDKKEGEMIVSLSIIKPGKDFHFSFEKVSKRTHLDIASVNTAISFNLIENILSDVHASMGGVFAFPKYLSQTVDFLNGKSVNDAIIKEALTILQKEISPISDARGSKEYKRLLAQQLFIAHFQTANS